MKLNNNINTFFTDSRLMLFIIIFVASILRFWNFQNIPFTHDEMSTLFRTRFDSFSDLIDLGVRTDTHPPGIQVFLYYWIKIFGDASWVVKLPFISMGLGLIWNVFLLGKKWFNESVGLISASLLAVLQFTVMYSQIARPYISGAFLVMGFTYYLSLFISNPKDKYVRNYFLVVLFAVLSAYNHHFSLLAVGLIGLQGLLFLDRKYLLKYLSIAVVVAIFYLPNINIFLSQLDRGGVGDWLGAPKARFLLDFLSYVFHHSYFILLLLLFIIGVGIYFFDKKKIRFVLIVNGIAFFIIYFLIGYYYSIYIAPIIQFSMLLFSFPILLISVLGWFPKLSAKWNGIVVGAILLVGTLSLTLERNHYYTFYHTRYFQMIEDANNPSLENEIDVIYGNIPNFVSYYETENNLNKPALVWDKDTGTISSFINLLDQCKTDYLILGMLETMPKEYLRLALEKYPYINEQKDYHGAVTYLMSKHSSENTINIDYYTKPLDFEDANLMNNNNGRVSTNGGILTYSCDSLEYGIGAEIDLQPIVLHKYDVINIQVDLDQDNIDDEVILVASFINGKEEVLWRGASSFTFNKENALHSKLILSVNRDVIDMDLTQPLILKTFIWNTKRSKVGISNFKITVSKGNRNKYCLFDKIE